MSKEHELAVTIDGHTIKSKFTDDFLQNHQKILGFDGREELAKFLAAEIIAELDRKENKR